MNIVAPIYMATMHAVSSNNPAENPRNKNAMMPLVFSIVKPMMIVASRTMAVALYMGLFFKPQKTMDVAYV